MNGDELFPSVTNPIQNHPSDKLECIWHILYVYDRIANRIDRLNWICIWKHSELELMIPSAMEIQKRGISFCFVLRFIWTYSFAFKMRHRNSSAKFNRSMSIPSSYTLNALRTSENWIWWQWWSETVNPKMNITFHIRIVVIVCSLYGFIRCYKKKTIKNNKTSKSIWGV